MCMMPKPQHDSVIRYDVHDADISVLLLARVADKFISVTLRNVVVGAALVLSGDENIFPGDFVVFKSHRQEKIRRCLLESCLFSFCSGFVHNAR